MCFGPLYSHIVNYIQINFCFHINIGPWVVLVSASNISLISGKGAQVFGVVVVGVVLRSRAVLYRIVGRAEFCLWAFVLRYRVLVFW